MVFREGKNYYVWQGPYNRPNHSRRYAALTGIVLVLFVGINLALARPHLSGLLSRLVDAKDQIAQKFDRNPDKKYSGPAVGGSGGDDKIASSSKKTAFKPNITIKELGIEISSVNIEVRMRPGEVKKVMTIASKGAKSISMVGRPAGGEGISWWPASANFDKGAVDLSIKIAPETPEGTYYGYATIVSHPSEKRKQVAEITVTVTNDTNESLSGGSSVQGAQTTSSNTVSRSQPSSQATTGVGGSSGTASTNPTTGGTGGSSTPPPSGGDSGAISLPSIDLPPILPPIETPPLPIEPIPLPLGL